MTRPRTIPLLLVALLLLSSLAPLASAGEAWTKETGSAITAVTTDERGDLIFVGTESGILSCYNSAGSEVWSAQVTTPSGNRPIAALDVGGDRLKVSTLGAPGRVEVRDVATGTVHWHFQAGGWGTLGRVAISQTEEVSGAIYTGQAVDLWNADGKRIFRIPGTYTDVCLSGEGDWGCTASGTTLNLYDISIPDWDGWIAPLPEWEWQKRVSHTITGSTDGALTDYPVEITVIRGTGTSSGNTLYAPDCRADFADIRFTAADGVTQLPYYLESVNGNTATFFVQIPSIPASPGTTTIYIYWANNAATTTTSDPAAVYAVYDDFNDGVIDPQWSVSKDPDGIVQETGGYLELKSPYGTAGNNGAYVSSAQFPGAAHIEINMKILSTYDSTNNNRHRIFECNGDPGIFNNPYHPALQQYWGGFSGNAATLDAFVKHDIYITGESTRWIAGNDWDVSSTQHLINGARFVFKTGDPGLRTAYGHMQIDWARISKWTPNEPTHGAWGPVESIVTPGDTKTLDGTITNIDAPETGDWVAVSTTTK
ncbi:MAG: DUF2341 domain-containing protein, partial [Bacilli bacterium]